MHHRSHDRGVSVCGSLFRGKVPVRGFCPGESLSKGEVCVQGSLFRGGSLSKEDGLHLGGLCPGVLCLGVSVQGMGSLSGVSVRETPRMVTSGQYASYWNAFLFTFLFLLF